MEKHSQAVVMVLLGNTGAGKSATGNTILGESLFFEGLSHWSVTRICQPAYTELNGQRITVIDTVGLSDTSVKKAATEDLKKKIEQIFDCTNDGLDVFLLVVKLGDKYTEEGQNTVKWIQENFGAKVSKHAIVLFTHGDELHEPMKKYLSRYPELSLVVDQCSGRYHVFNNKTTDRYQVTELLKQIESLRMKNGYDRYTEHDYEEAQKELLKRNSCVGKTSGGDVVAAGVGGAGVFETVAGVFGAVGAVGLGISAQVALRSGKAAVIGALVGAFVGAAAGRATGHFFERQRNTRNEDNND